MKLVVGIIKESWLIPVFFVCSLFLFAGWQYYLFGHWPTYGNPDAGTFIGIALIIDKLIFALGTITLISFTILIPFAIYNLWNNRIFHWSLQYIIVTIVCLTGLYFDPSNTLNWYMD